MPNEPKPRSEWARKRASGEARRAKLIERRETYFDLLVSGYTVQQIAAATKMSPSAVRRAIDQALAKRQLDAPEDYARLQVARLSKALRCADVALEQGDLKAIAPFVTLVRELNLYHGLGQPQIAAPTPRFALESAPPLALTHSPGLATGELFEDMKSCATPEAMPTSGGANSMASS